ncbi:MAG TPA: matrixin family metalloprotease, partial [Bryobacteraceae bacterium]|nr:matrixin family metalloprotease [Bryobacteraceae bacterium]
MMRLTWLLLLAPSCFGYISQVTADSQQTPLTRSDNAGIQFYLSDKVVPGVQSSASGPTVTVISSDSNPQQAIHAALATWNAVSTANVNFLSLKSTSLGINSSDKQMTIAIASSSSDVSTVGGALAVTIDSYTVPGGVIVDSDIIVSASKQFSTTGAANTFDLQAVMTHELGHSLGANHTGILGATMFQYNTPVQRQLSSDDLAFLNAMYPSTTSPVSFGGISGKVTITGTAGSALLTMVDTGTGATFGGVSAGDGTFTVKVPAGTYQMYAEPLNGVVQPVNLYFSPQLTAGSLQSTMFSGTVTVTANNTATANVTANSAPSPPLLVVPNIAIIAHNSTQLPGQFPQGGPVFVPSGGQGGLVDLLMYGTGIDATLSAGNFAILGQGVTVNSVGQVPNLSPFTLRVTLNVASQQSLSLASIFMTKGSSTLTLSGALVIGPPTPTTTSQSIINSASYAGGVSPGGIYALFDIPGAPNLGPAVAVGNSGHYDPYGFLASTLGGVTVTFDGVPAPLFFVYGGQI